MIKAAEAAQTVRQQMTLDIAVTYALQATFILGMMLTNRLLFPRQAKRLFRQNKEVSSPQEIEISENGMKLINSFGHSVRSWSHFIKWKEDKECFLLYHADLMFTIIPKRFFHESLEISFVSEQLQKHGVPVAGMPWQFLVHI